MLTAAVTTPEGTTSEATAPGVTGTGVTASAQLRQQARASAWARARATFPARAAATHWPATHHDRDTALAVLTRPPFTMSHPGSQRGRRRGLVIALSWLSDQPGETWQQRWLSTGTDEAGTEWKQVCQPWLAAHDIHAANRLDLLSLGMITMMCGIWSGPLCAG